MKNWESRNLNVTELRFTNQEGVRNFQNRLNQTYTKVTAQANEFCLSDSNLVKQKEKQGLFAPLDDSGSI